MALAERVVYLLPEVRETFFAQALQEDVGKGFGGCNAIPLGILYNWVERENRPRSPHVSGGGGVLGGAEARVCA